MSSALLPSVGLSRYVLHTVLLISAQPGYDSCGNATSPLQEGVPIRRSPTYSETYPPLQSLGSGRS